MKAITIKQPWAEAVASRAEDPAAKDVENRKRGFPRFYRGPVMIHSGAAWSKRGAEDDRVRTWWGRHQGFTDGFQVAPTPNPDLLPRKAVLALADLIDVHDAHPGCCDSEWAELAYTESHGVLIDRVLHLVLADVTRLERPVPAAGQLGLWTPTTDLLAEVINALP